MGAESRVDILKGSTLKGAFQQAQDQDRMENGHSYTGGLGMAAGYRVVSKPLPQFAAVRLGERLLEDRDGAGPQKWGEAHVIPITPIPNRRTIELEVDVTGLEYAQRNEAIEAAVLPKLHKGEAISEVIYNGGGRTYGSIKGKGKKVTKIVKTLGKGKLDRRYLVARRYGERGDQTILGGFDTLELAQKYAVEVAEREYGDDFTLSIYPYQKREDGPYYTYKKVVTKETLWVQATVGVPKGEPSSWVVAGVYSC